MNRAWGWVALLMLVIVGAGSLYFAERSGVAFDVCQTGDEISIRDQDAMADVARAVVSRIREGETTATIENMSDAGRRDSTRASVLQVAEMAAQNPVAELEARRVFRLTSIGSRRGFAACLEDNGVSYVARGGGFQSVFVVLAEQFQTGERSWTLWLERERGEWRVRGLHLGFSAIGGIDGARWRQMASEQRQKNNVFNATMLYDVASSMLYRGGFLQPSEADGFTREREMYRRHQDFIDGRLQFGGAAFEVAAINAMSTDNDGLVLVIDQALSEPLTVDEAIARNHSLIDAMNLHRPEWREVFDGVAAGVPIGPNRLWRTLYKRDGGYPPETQSL